MGLHLGVSLLYWTPAARVIDTDRLTALTASHWMDAARSSALLIAYRADLRGYLHFLDHPIDGHTALQTPRSR